MTQENKQTAPKTAQKGQQGKQDEQTQVPQQPQKESAQAAAVETQTHGGQQEMMQKLEKDLTEAQKQIEDLTNAYKRALADLQNFKRRTDEDQKNLVSFANASLILEILPVLLNFERAVAHQPKNAPKEWLEGILQIYAQLKQILQKKGVEEIKSVGGKYDPNLHEVLLQVEGDDGIIMQEIEKGYLLKGKVIRPAKVAVGNGKG